MRAYFNLPKFITISATEALWPKGNRKFLNNRDNIIAALPPLWLSTYIRYYYCYCEVYEVLQCFHTSLSIEYIALVF